MKWGNAGSEAVRLAAALLRGRRGAVAGTPAASGFRVFRLIRDGRLFDNSFAVGGRSGIPSCAGWPPTRAVPRTVPILANPQNCERGQKWLGDKRNAFRSPGLWKMLAGERTTTGAVGGQRLHKDSWKFGERRRAAARKDRRKPGVAWRSAASEGKNSSRILLTENGSRKILRVRQQLPSQRTFQRSFPDPHAGKQSARSTGVCTIGKSDELVRNGSGSHSL